jgi:2'-5' RNA ligase
VRLFVALAPPRDVLADVGAALGPARELQPDLRWIPVERWHLTLAFYGEVPDESLSGVIDMVERKLSRRPPSGPIELSFSGAGQFSRRALWVGVDGDVARLRALARSVTTDRRPYRPHLTVARLRSGQDATRAAEALSSYAGPPWRADTVHLVRSFQGPKPRYETVGSWPATGRVPES